MSDRSVTETPVTTGPVPGLALAALAVALAWSLSSLVDVLSPLVVAVVLGVIAVNVGLIRPAASPGLAFASKRLLRLGVVLLGFRLAVADVLRVGGPGLLLVATAVVLTFFGTRWLGKRLGLPPKLSLLTATGFAICGVSAVAAMEGVIEAEEEDVTFSVALVTLCGTLAMVTLPIIAGMIGLGGELFGQWVGASVHDVAQVLATAAVGGETALEAAVVVKLTRVLFLGPLVAGVALSTRRRQRGDATKVAPPIVPLFVAGFLAAVAVRSSGILPEGWLAVIKLAESLLLTAALFALGTGVELARLRVTGGRGLVLGLLSWFLIAAVTLAGVLLYAGG